MNPNPSEGARSWPQTIDALLMLPPAGSAQPEATPVLQSAFSNGSPRVALLMAPLSATRQRAPSLPPSPAPSPASFLSPRPAAPGSAGSRPRESPASASGGGWLAVARTPVAAAVRSTPPAASTGKVRWVAVLLWCCAQPLKSRRCHIDTSSTIHVSVRPQSMDMCCGVPKRHALPWVCPPLKPGWPLQWSRGMRTPPSAGAPPAASYPALPEGGAPELMSVERVPGASDASQS